MQVLDPAPEVMTKKLRRVAPSNVSTSSSGDPGNLICNYKTNKQTTNNPHPRPSLPPAALLTSYKGLLPRDLEALAVTAPTKQIQSDSHLTETLLLSAGRGKKRHEPEGTLGQWFGGRTPSGFHTRAEQQQLQTFTAAPAQFLGAGSESGIFHLSLLFWRFNLVC